MTCHAIVRVAGRRRLFRSREDRSLTKRCPEAQRPWTALAGIVLVLLLPLGAAAGLLLMAGADDMAADTVLPDAYVWRVVRFTLLQAALSTLLSVTLGMWVGHALFRQGHMAGHGLVTRLLLLPFALPQLVAVLGLLAVWGRHGWVNQLLQALGMQDGISLYGLPGILLAHVFYNAPLVARLVHVRLAAMPTEYLRLAAQLGIPRRAFWRLVTWPVLRGILPGAALLVFMLCAGSFTVVLVLGGGPGATTLEVAIYQSLRFDFAPARALILALLQMVLTGTLFLLLRRLAAWPDTMAGLSPVAPHPHAQEHGARLIDGAAILLLVALVALPLAGIMQAGLAADLARLLQETAVWQALVTSLAMAAAATMLALMACALLLTSMAAPRGGVRTGAWPNLAEAVASLVLVISPVILAAGWFVLLARTDLAQERTAAFWLVSGINALMSLPFVWRTLAPAWRDLRQRHGRLCAQLGLSLPTRWRLVILPGLAPALGPALAMSLALSLGDLGAVALLGSEEFRTLPLLIYQRLGSYRTADAAGLSLILLLMVTALMLATERLARKGDIRP